MLSWAAAALPAMTSCLLCAVVVTLEPLPGAETYVNGKQITEAVVLKQGPPALPVCFIVQLPVVTS